MSKAEERGKIYALHKASEKLNDYYGSAMLSVVQFDGYDIKNAYIEGYQQAEKDLADKAKTSSDWDGFFYGQGYKQAEKDLELTWEDIADILDVTDVIANDDSMEERLKTMSEEEYCQEVLKRFKAMKK